MACSYCYARRMYKRFKWNPEIRFDINWMMPIYKIKMPSRIFMGSTIELFGGWVPDKWLRDIFTFAREFPQHTFIFLTKQPQNLIKWSPFPENCWVGVSATDIESLNNACHYLHDVKATLRFISIEPLLKRINLTWFEYGKIGWLIIGQQTPVKKATMPKIEWLQEIALAATKVHIPLFLKDNLRPLLPNRMPFWDAVSWTERDHTNTPIRMSEYRLRQEFPAGKG